MNSRMLRDIGMSRTDAEYHAGRFKRDRKRTGSGNREMKNDGS